MITIKVSSNELGDAVTAHQALQDASVFGSVLLALADSQTPTSEVLETLAKRWGGELSLYAWVNDLDEETALTWLNQGIDCLVVPQSTFDQLSQSVPEHRLRLAHDFLGGDLAFGAKASTRMQKSNQIIELEQLRHDPCSIGDGLFSQLRSDHPQGYIPTVICDRFGHNLGLAYSNRESLSVAIRDRQGVYWSRSRNELWVKGATSGQTQGLRQVQIDCDNDALRFIVEQRGGFCHCGTYDCFGGDRTLARLESVLAERLTGTDTSSITYRLSQNPQRLREKLFEEVNELLDAKTAEEANWECADVLYFAMIALQRRGGELSRVFDELARRSLRVTRRPPKGEIC